MKTLFVITAYPRFKGDVITPWLVELIMKLKERGVDVSVFTSSYRGLRTHVLDGVKVYRFRYCFQRFERLTHEETAVDRIKRGPGNAILTFFYLFFGAWSIVRLAKSEKFDIIHVHWPFPHVLFGILGKKCCRARLFSSFYGVEIRLLTKKMKFMLRPFAMLINKSDKITAISTHTARELEGVVEKPVHIIPFSAAMGRCHERSSEKKEILFVGRLVTRKGVKYLIEAFHKVHRSISHDLVIVGGGPERGRLEKLAADLDLKHRVRFAGVISDDALNQYYASCSFLVLPAIVDEKGDTEGLGVVLLEAMSCGKPVIASNVGGITDIVVDRKNGFLVPPAEPEALAAAIKRMAKDRKLRKALGRAALKTVDEKFNWDKIVGDLIRLYHDKNG
ncbi:MAG: glycosyltransferase family 4 protein [candidate division WOR-3 bacterium]|nr:MAG: glycosyltransferase family 4 protein [candidate division WOR-3 bacterium]